MTIQLLRDCLFLKAKAGDIIADGELSDKQVSALLFSGEAKVIDRTAVVPTAKRKAVTK